jgi:hypothetical protein
MNLQGWNEEINVIIDTHVPNTTLENEKEYTYR